MSDFLHAMTLGSRARAARLDPTELRARQKDAPPVRPLALGRFAVIAELKRRSPLDGALDDGAPDRRLAAYRAGGAAAISVLTEPTRFDGSMADLARAARTVDVPVMRKDFLVEPLQVDEARAAGASGVLLIVRILSDDGLRRMCDRAAELGMFALVEVFDEADLDRVGPDTALVGVNARDLGTLRVDRTTLHRLAPRLPDVPVIAESGHHTVDDVRASAALGYRGVLAGTALMRTPDPAAVIAAFRGAACS